MHPPPIDLQITDVLTLAPDQQLSTLLRRTGGDITEVIQALQRRAQRRAGLYPSDEASFWCEARHWLSAMSQDLAPDETTRRDFHQLQRGLLGQLGWQAAMNVLERMELIMYGMEPEAAWTSPMAELLLTAWNAKPMNTEHLN